MADLEIHDVPQQLGVRRAPPLALREGRVFLYFFDPECLHCDHGARQLAKLKWGETAVVGVAVEHAQFGEEFMVSTGLQGLLSTDSDALREVFKFSTVPFAVALESGRQRASFTSFEESEPAATLKRLGFVH